jgi:uncharacterized membrane protein
VELSQKDLKLLLEQVRSLTARVQQIEQLLRIATAVPTQPAASRPPASEIRGENGATPVSPPLFVTAAPTTPDPPAPSMPSIGHADAETGLETRIGSHWLNRIGIAAVLIGASYFLKFAFENNWIGPTGRIAIGLIAGIAVVLWSERFRSRGYRIFSYSLKAVGIGVLYLSFWAAFQMYNLISAEVAFACMIVVTAATCAMSLAQDAEILSVLAITGGFSTPVLLSTGVNREITLFSYVVLLDLGILALVIFKPWRRLLWLGYVGTFLLYMGWYVAYYSRSQLEPTLIFATIFFAVFAIAPLFMLREEHGAGMMPLALAFVNAATYFLQSYAMISEVSKTAMAWFALALAAVYLVLNRLRPRCSDETAERNLQLMHLALAVGLITVAIPIRLAAHWITIGWFVESAVLLWLGGRIKSDLLNVFALTALALGVGRLLFFDDFAPGALIFNLRMATYAIAVAVLAFVAYQASKGDRDYGQTIGATAIVALNALALVALSYEIHDYYARQLAIGLPAHVPWTAKNWSEMHSIEIARGFTYSALFMAYGAMLMIVGFLRNSAFVRWQALVLIAATTVKVFVYDISQLDRIYRILSLVVLGILLLTISFAYQRDWLKLSSKRSTSPEIAE